MQSLARFLFSALICAFVMTAASVATPLLQDNCCQNSDEILSLTVYSTPFDCCDINARLSSAQTAVQDAIDRVYDICPDCAVHALARICVDYEQNDDGMCVAKATVYYVCCCCIVLNHNLPACNYDTGLCENSVADTRESSADYVCCDDADRRNAIANTMLNAYNAADAYCDMLDCIPDYMGVRGFQIDFAAESCDSDVCQVHTTFFFTCCCVCQY